MNQPSVKCALLSGAPSGIRRTSAVRLAERGAIVGLLGTEIGIERLDERGLNCSNQDLDRVTRL